MKKIPLLIFATITSMIALTSCETGHYYYSQPYPRSSFSLIISPGPGIGISRYSDGRYYYRSPEGYMYWRGYDNRFYLDKSYLGRGHYERRDYDDWRNNGRGHSRRHR